MGWLSSLDDVQMLRADVQSLVGAELVAVRYVALDYRRFDLAPGHRGPRVIIDQIEWMAPDWTHASGDGIDYGVELDLSSGRTLAVTWESPGNHESLDVFAGKLIGSVLDVEPDVAVWEVTTGSRWSDLIGNPITAIELHYVPWAPDEGYWCTRVTVEFGRANVVLLLGEFTPTGDVAPSADNVAVLFSPQSLPEWELRLA